MTFNPQDPLSNGPVVYQSVLDLCFMVHRTPEVEKWLKETGTPHNRLGGSETYSVEFHNKQDAALFKLMFV